MNNLYKLIAFLCLVFVTHTLSAQARPAYISPDGLITLDATTAEVFPEYVADIANFHLTTLQSAQFYFQKYIEKTSTRGIEFLFDFVNQKMYIRIDSAHQYLIPLSNNKITVQDFNLVLKMIHEGLL